MRRPLLLLLAVVLPLKAVAAAVVPITGAPEHRHADVVAPASHAHGDPGTHDRCDARADRIDQGVGLHEHSCPHLAMALIVPCAPAELSRTDAPRAPQVRTVRFASVVHDVPRPPPTSLL